jgi:hypothetical protein
VIYGFFSDPGIYVRSLNININLWWGLALLVFGSIMTYFGRRKTKLRPSSTR